MDCKRCRINGIERNGGPLGLCWKHQKTKCSICGHVSAGNEMCSRCAHEADELRWQSEANFRVVDPDDQSTYLELRKERLMEAKHYAHRAVEVLFKGLLMSVQALWGSDSEEPKIEHKKAA